MMPRSEEFLLDERNRSEAAHDAAREKWERFNETRAEPVTGWFPDLSMAEYLAIPAMGASGLVEFRRSPAHFDHARRHPKEPTPAMREGTALHLALLEPDLYAGRYVSLGQCEGVKKDLSRCTNGGSSYRGGASFCGVHDPAKGEPMDDGVEVMPNEAIGRIEGMRRAVLAHPELGQFFRGRGVSELTGVWLDEASGLLCKIRLDRYVERAGVHFDLKRTVSAEREAFRRQVVRMGYAFRSAFYRRGMAALDKPAMASVLGAVEADAPHGVQAFLLDESDLETFTPEIDRLLYQAAECEATGDYPAYPGGLRELKLPAWGLSEFTDDTELENTDG